MPQPLFDTYVMVDWSAASAPTTGANSIWIGVARRGQTTTVENVATRTATIERLVCILSTERGLGRRVLAGFDFPFGYPTGVARHLTGSDEALALWDWLSERIEDRSDNRNNRYAVASEINRRYTGIGPFWGRPDGWDFPEVPTRGKIRNGTNHPPERRLAETIAKGAKTVWQLAYAGSVGSQVLLGLPALNRIRRDARIAADTKVWPFETGLAAPEAPIVLAEIYPSLIPPDASEPIKDAGQVRAVADWMAARDSEDKLRSLFEGPRGLPADDRNAVETEEAWILGIRLQTGSALLEQNSSRTANREGTRQRQLESSRSPTLTPAGGGDAPQLLRYERDPVAIYRQSFATVRDEARLDHLPEDLHEVAIRLVHASGMTDVPNRLAWSADLVASARAALARGAPILCDCEMAASGIVRGRLPAANPVVCSLNDPAVPGLAARIGNTRSAAAVERWRDRIAGAVVVIGNAPTALFHLLELLDAGWPRPAAILGFPVGFVGAAESKAELARDPRGVAFLTLRGRRGGSAMAAATLNALAAGLEAPR